MRKTTTLSPKIISEAINDHCKGVTKRYILTGGGEQEISVIPEGDIYRLIERSKFPTDKQFKRWVTSEVLPSMLEH